MFFSKEIQVKDEIINECGCDRYMQASVRVMPGCFITGQAAGMAVSVAVRSGADTDKIDVNVLREKLKK